MPAHDIVKHEGKRGTPGTPLARQWGLNFRILLQKLQMIHRVVEEQVGLWHRAEAGQTGQP